MCESFPSRREKLDAYELDIVDMSKRFSGLAYYEYHMAFAARAVALLLNHGIKVDWS